MADSNGRYQYRRRVVLPRRDKGGDPSFSRSRAIVPRHDPVGWTNISQPPMLMALRITNSGAVEGYGDGGLGGLISDRLTNAPTTRRGTARRSSPSWLSSPGSTAVRT